MNTNTKINLPAVPHWTGGKEVAEFGNRLLFALVEQAAISEQATALSDAAEKTDGFIGFELSRAIIGLQEKDEAIDVFAINGGKDNVAALYNRILIGMGVLRASVTGAKDVTYTYTDPKIAALYDYSAVADKASEEWKRRQRNRNRLNDRLNRACFAACTLLSNMNTSADLLLETDKETGQTVAVVNNAPAEIAGKRGERVTLGGRTKAKNATETPTFNSLVKIAKAKAKPASAPRTTTGDGIGAGMTDEAFGLLVNNLIRAINAQEKTFTSAMNAHMKTLQPVLAAAVKVKPTTKSTNNGKSTKK